MVKSDSLVVSSPQREHSVEPSPPLASAAPPPPFFSGPSPGRHAGTPGRPRPAAASALVSGSSPPWGRTFELILRLWLFELEAYESETASFLCNKNYTDWRRRISCVTVRDAPTSGAFGWPPWWSWADWWGPRTEWDPPVCRPRSSCGLSAWSWLGMGKCSPAGLETLEYKTNIVRYTSIPDKKHFIIQHKAIAHIAFIFFYLVTSTNQFT